MEMYKIMGFWKVSATTPLYGKVPEKACNLTVWHHEQRIGSLIGKGMVFSFLSRVFYSGYCPHISSTPNGNIEKKGEKQGCSGIDRV
jgi:hypothetical protein